MSDRIFGKYEKIRRLAQGGMGDVYLGRQSGIVGFDRLIILKSLRKDLADEDGFIEQFLDEARVAANLNHPNVVSIFEVGEWRGSYYLAMEYINGEDLSRLWYAAAKKGLGLPFSVTVKIVHDAALGLHHAHDATDVHGHALRIVHRDISPQNIMVRADGLTKVVDFGIAKAANKVSKTQVGTVKGKLQYMSPEQVKGEILDGRSDQFSLGVVLWEMCTGKRLFKAESEIETLNKILTHPIPAASSIVRNFPSELEAVISKMLTRDRDQRYESCHDVAQDLAAYLERTKKAKGMNVAQFVDEVLGETLKERIKDLTPEAPADPEDQLATTEGAPIATDEDVGQILVRRISGDEYRYADFPQVKAAIEGGALIAGDRILLGRGKSMALMEHPQLVDLFVTPPAPAPSGRAQTELDAQSETNLSTEDGAHQPGSMPAPHGVAPADQNLSLMAVPSPSGPAPGVPAAGPAAQALSSSPPSPSPSPNYQEGPMHLGDAQNPVPTHSFAPMAAPGVAPMPTGPYGPGAPAYQLPTSPPGYPSQYPMPAGQPPGPHLSADAWAMQSGGDPSSGHPAYSQANEFSQEFRPPKSKAPWVVAALLLVVLVPGALFVADPVLFASLKARVLGSPLPALSEQSLRAAIFSDDEQALQDALRTVNASGEQGGPRARASAAAQQALLRAGLAQIELERARLYGTSAGDANRSRANASQSAAEAHRVAAYRAANTAVGLAGDLQAAYLAKASYQGLLGANQEMEADFKRALDVTGPAGLAPLNAESQALRALVQTRRATGLAVSTKVESNDAHVKGELNKALSMIAQARTAEKNAALTLSDHRLSYAEATLLVELVRRRARDPVKVKGVIEALSRAHPKNDRVRLLEERLGVKTSVGKKGGPGGALTNPKKPSVVVPGQPPKTPAAPTYASLKMQADRAQRKEQPQKAIRLYREALKLKRSAAAYAGLGWSLLDNDQADDAVDAFESALSRKPNWPLAVFGQAEALRFSGRKSAAARRYKAYLDLAPDGEDAPVARRAIKQLDG